MADRSAIEWTDASWNPIVGCSIVSPGCTNCYAMKMAARIEAMAEKRRECLLGPMTHYAGTTKKVNGNAVWTGKVARANGRVFGAPLDWRKPRRIFVNSMGDLFHESIPDEWILDVFTVMGAARQHTFQVLTKRAARMREFVSRRDLLEDIYVNWSGYSGAAREVESWPLPNVWLGVSAERQQEADERIPLLLATPAAVRFVSAEPLLGPIDLSRVRAPEDNEDGSWRFSALACGDYYEQECDPDVLTGKCYYSSGDGPYRETKLDWVIVGGESGPNARPMHPDWARSLRDQCQAAGVSFFFKQWGEWAPQTIEQRAALSGRTRKHNCGQLPKSTATYVYRVGKKAAGRRLDGVEHNGFPEARA